MKRANFNIKYSKHSKYRNLKELIENRFGILSVLLIVLMFVLFMNLFLVQVVRSDYYKVKVESISQKIIYGDTAPRGRIYDRNHNLIVDNKAIKTISYSKPYGISSSEEINVAYSLGELIDLEHQKLNDYDLRNFWVIKYKGAASNKITDSEWSLLDERKLSLDDVYSYQRERITDSDLSVFTNVDREAAYIYYLMNKGYSFESKIIKNTNVTDKEYALASEASSYLDGISTKLNWERIYPYGNVFKSILGRVSSTSEGLPFELKEYYLQKGYALDDRVGISYLEYQYEDYLKGTKNKYKILDSGESELIEEGKRGNDLILSIDINLQKEVEEILKVQIIKAKSDRNTEYYNRSFVIITEPASGDILAMSGKKVYEDEGEYKVYDYTPGITTSPITPGSSVKGASQIVGYNTGALKIGEVRYDTCVKIAETPLKCSFSYLGKLNDITALKYSSNTYQFYTAMKVAEGNYKYNKPLSINPGAFDIYRDTFSEFGLGVKTGIDLPVESYGYKGSSRLPGHLLDFSIGQYDTYTPIQLSQYIGTIANRGERVEPHLLKTVYAPTKTPFEEVIKVNNPKVLNVVNTESNYLERVILGFKEVVKPGGTGYTDLPLSQNPAAKTGTSQSFIDTDLDGIVDTETYSKVFVGFAPADNPKVAFTVVSPDVSHPVEGKEYTSNINRIITREVSKKFFEIYE